MDKQIAYELIDIELQAWRRLPYSELLALIGSNENKEVVGDDGCEYQLEIDVRWDSKRGGDIRVIVAADYGFWRVFKPFTRAFIKRADGTFVGESLE